MFVCVIQPQYCVYTVVQTQTLIFNTPFTATFYLNQRPTLQTQMLWMLSTPICSVFEENVNPINKDSSYITPLTLGGASVPGHGKILHMDTFFFFFWWGFKVYYQYF